MDTLLPLSESTTHPGVLKAPKTPELERRFGIEIPRLSIAELPTPLTSLTEAGYRDCLVKRDDLTSSIYGGNKARKLSYLLADAELRGCDTILTMGAYGSHHVLATAIHGQRFGFDVHAVLTPQRENEHVRENLRCALAANLHVHRSASALRDLTQRKVEWSLRRAGKKPYVIGHGGSDTLGVVAYVEAGLEMDTQFRNSDLKEPTRIVAPLGSGATTIGLAIGCAAAGIASEIIAVRATPTHLVKPRALRAMLSSTVDYLRERNPAFPDVKRQAWRNLRIDHSAYGTEYGLPTADSAQAMARGIVAGIELDPTYTSKAFSTFLKTYRRHKEPILFLRTYNSASLDAWLLTAPKSPAWLKS